MGQRGLDEAAVATGGAVGGRLGLEHDDVAATDPPPWPARAAHSPVKPAPTISRSAVVVAASGGAGAGASGESSQNGRGAAPASAGCTAAPEPLDGAHADATAVPTIIGLMCGAALGRRPCSHGLDGERRGLDRPERVAVGVTAVAEKPLDRLEPVLPARGPGLLGADVLEEEEPPARAQDALHLVERRRGAGHGAEDEGAHRRCRTGRPRRAGGRPARAHDLSLAAGRPRRASHSRRPMYSPGSVSTSSVTASG